MRPDFAEDLEVFDGDLPEDFDEDARGVFVGDFLLDDFFEALREAAPRFEAVFLAVLDAAFVAREAAFDVWPATLRAALLVLRAASLALSESTAVFALDCPSVEGSGRIMSPAAGLTAPTAPAAVSRAALASPAACSPA